MRGTAVRSFLLGSVLPDARTNTHSHTRRYSIVRSEGLTFPGWSDDGGQLRQHLTGNPAAQFTIRISFFPHPCPPPSYYSGASWLPGLFVCSCGWGCSVGRMHRVCGHWRHGEKGRGGHSSWILALNTKVLLLFFPLPPVVLWPTYW